MLTLDLRLMEMFSGGPSSALPLIPKVVSSTLIESQADGIMVKWDRPMMVTCEIASQVSVIVDGAAPTHPDHTVFNQVDPSEIGFIFGAPFLHGQVVTWAYDDSGACDLKEASPPNTEAENQTYAVYNQIPDQVILRAFSNGFSGGFK